MSKLDELRVKTDKTPLENALALFADYELEARKDGKNIVATLAAAELAALKAERDELLKLVASLDVHLPKQTIRIGENVYYQFLLEGSEAEKIRAAALKGETK